jgi:hypothetical protein
MLTQIGETYILLSNRIGQSLAPIPDFASLEYAKTVNQVGVMTVLLPIKYQSNIQFLNQMVIIRRAYGGMRYQEFGALWFVVKYQIYTDDQGVRWVKVTCFCGNAILPKAGGSLLRRFHQRLHDRICRKPYETGLPGQYRLYR